jgi:outer membrane lipopolysaccharide assembly protein LptE/RlpB
MKYLPPNTPIVATLADLVTIAGGLVAIGIALWQFQLYRHLNDNEASIKAKQAEIDKVTADIQGRTSRSLVSQSQLEKQIAVAQAPLEHELKLLERDRKFILNRILFAKK